MDKGMSYNLLCSAEEWALTAGVTSDSWPVSPP